MIKTDSGLELLLNKTHPSEISQKQNSKGGTMIRAMVGSMILFCMTAFVQAGDTAADKAKGCTRKTLQAAVDSYLAAQKAGDMSKAQLADKVKYIENMTEIKKEQGLWNTPLVIDFDRSFFDVNACRTFTEVIVAKGDKPYVLGTRLKVEKGKISEINSMVSKKDDWLFNAGDYLKYSTMEDWRVLNADERVDRETLINGGNAYFDAFSDRSVKIPFNKPCARLEGGLYTTKDFNDPNATCYLGFPEGEDKLPILKRDYVVDVDMGTVNIFCRFGRQPGMPDSHTFRLVNGKIRYVHTLTPSVPGLDFNAIMGPPSKAKPEAPTKGD
jgi:hypothetical protein